MKRKIKKNGFSLIEAMLAIVVFMVLLLGAGAVNFQSGSGILKQQFKREGIVRANTELEAYWNTTFDNLKTNAGQTINSQTSVNGKLLPMKTVISSVGVDSMGESYIEISIEIGDGASDNYVVLKGRRYEFGLSKVAI